MRRQVTEEDMHMDQQHKIRCSTSLGISKMKIKSPLTFLANRLAKIKKKEMAALEKVWRIRYLFTVGRTIKWYGFGKARWSTKN